MLEVPWRADRGLPRCQEVTSVCAADNLLRVAGVEYGSAGIGGFPDPRIGGVAVIGVWLVGCPGIAPGEAHSESAEVRKQRVERLLAPRRSDVSKRG